MQRQEVILVDEWDKPIGIMEKMEAHERAALHRAFSVFIFNSAHEMLLQQRADTKYHSAGLWTNACCSHPQPGEDTAAAASRRLHEELGFTVPLSKAFDFTYRTPFSNGLTEHEYDHVFVGTYDGPVTPDKNEVKNIAFMRLAELELSLKNEPGSYTSWFRIAFPRIREWIEKRSKT